MCVFGAPVWFKPRGRPGRVTGHSAGFGCWHSTLWTRGEQWVGTDIGGTTLSQQIPWWKKPPQWWVWSDTMGRKLPRYEILKIASVFGDVTRLQWGSTLKLVSVLRLTIISWNSHRQVRNPGIQEWTNEWITAYLHLAGEGKLTIMSYVMIPHDFTSVNASRGEVSGVLCSKCFHMISHVHHVHILNARLFASWSFLVWTPRKCVTGGDCISWLHCKGLELAGWRMCTNLIRPFSGNAALEVGPLQLLGKV